jgi:hypothetical protein
VFICRGHGHAPDRTQLVYDFAAGVHCQHRRDGEMIVLLLGTMDISLAAILFAGVVTAGS